MYKKDQLIKSITRKLKQKVYLSLVSNMRKISAYYRSFFQCFVLVILVFMIHVITIENRGHNLNILSLNDLPQVFSLGCFKSKRILEGLVKVLYLYTRIIDVSTLVEAVICVKEDDLYISDSIAETGAWEPENVHNLMKAMSLYKDAVLIGKFSYKDIF